MKRRNTAANWTNKKKKKAEIVSRIINAKGRLSDGAMDEKSEIISRTINETSGIPSRTMDEKKAAYNAAE